LRLPPTHKPAGAGTIGASACVYSPPSAPDIGFRRIGTVAHSACICQITGKQQTTTAGVTDIAAVTKGAGLTDSHWARDEAHFMQLLDRRRAIRR
jgi:hypothetical protein